MFPNDRTAYARWTFERPADDERPARPGYFRFTEQEQETTDQGVSLTWTQYCWFLFLRNRVDDGLITTGAVEGGERYPADGASAPLPREELARAVARPRRGIPFVKAKAAVKV